MLLSAAGLLCAVDPRQEDTFAADWLSSSSFSFAGARRTIHSRQLHWRTMLKRLRETHSLGFDNRRCESTDASLHPNEFPRGCALIAETYIRLHGFGTRRLITAACSTHRAAPPPHHRGICCAMCGRSIFVHGRFGRDAASSPRGRRFHRDSLFLRIPVLNLPRSGNTGNSSQCPHGGLDSDHNYS